MRHRFASSTDSQILGELNHQLIRDEGHRNRMSIPELVTRIDKWLAGGIVPQFSRTILAS